MGVGREAGKIDEKNTRPYPLFTCPGTEVPIDTASACPSQFNEPIPREFFSLSPIEKRASLVLIG